MVDLFEVESGKTYEKNICMSCDHRNVETHCCDWFVKGFISFPAWFAKPNAVDTRYFNEKYVCDGFKIEETKQINTIDKEPPSAA